jgi:hypothetical protein
MNFKEFLYKEIFFSQTFNYLKNKLFNLLTYIKSFVLSSKKVEKGAVTFSFPILNLHESTQFEDITQDTVNGEDLNQLLNGNYFLYPRKLKEEILQKLSDILKKPNMDTSNLPTKELDFLIKKLNYEYKDYLAKISGPLKKIDPQKAGYLFEIECYFAITKKGYTGLSDNNIPQYYERFKILLQNFYEQILKQADQLAELMILEAKKSMPCIDHVIFNGGSMRGGRKDPADIKLICKEQQTGYSIKHSTKDGINSINIANLSRDPLDEFNGDIRTPAEFAKFLNKMINEYNNTYLAIGGEKAKMLHALLSNDFSIDPKTGQLSPKHNTNVIKNINKKSIQYVYGKTAIRINNIESGYLVTLIPFLRTRGRQHNHERKKQENIDQYKKEKTEHYNKPGLKPKFPSYQDWLKQKSLS